MLVDAQGHLACDEEDLDVGAIGGVFRPVGPHHNSWVRRAEKPFA